MTSETVKPARPTWLIFFLLSALTVSAFVLLLWVIALKGSYNNERVYVPDRRPHPQVSQCLEVLGGLQLCQAPLGSERTEGQRADDDLRSQREMADWAFAMVILSGGGLALSTLSIVLIFETFRATRDQLRLAEDQARIARYVFDGRLVRVETRLEAAESGYVFKYRFKNVGTSHVSELRCDAAIVQIAVDPKSRQTHRFVPSFDMKDVEGRADVSLDFVNSAMRLSSLQEQALREGTLMAYVDIELKGKDAFGKTVDGSGHFHGRLLRHASGTILADLRPTEQALE